MPIPGDRRGRWWIETSNGPLIDAFRPALISFVAFGPSKEPSLEGTGFFVTGTEQWAVALTAKHVLEDGVARKQSAQKHAASAIFFNKARPSPLLHKLRALWTPDREQGAMLAVYHGYYDEPLDIATCIVGAPPDQKAPPLNKVHIPLDLAVPDVGDRVGMVSFADMSLDETRAPDAATGRGQTLSVYRLVSVRMGVVTANLPDGHRLGSWPCFTTSIPAAAGMSGGFVYRWRDGEAVAACGVVCADASPVEAPNNSLIAGESVVGAIWPALGLLVPDAWPVTDETRYRTLYEKMRDGELPPPVGGLESVIFEDRGNGLVAIGLR